MKEFTDISAAQPVEKRLLEKDIQSACVTWARSRGFWCRKFSSPANRSVPDYLMAWRTEKFFVEFKAPGKVATPNQLDEQKLMVNAGWDGMQECDSIQQFKDWVQGYIGCLPNPI